MCRLFLRWFVLEQISFTRIVEQVVDDVLRVFFLVGFATLAKPGYRGEKQIIPTAELWKYLGFRLRVRAARLRLARTLAMISEQLSADAAELLFVFACCAICYKYGQIYCCATF